MKQYPSTEQLAEMVKQLTQARLENWLGEGFGSWRWWVLLAFLILPWIIWRKYANKKQLLESSLLGMIIMVFSITLDELGFELSLWNYPVDVIPTTFPRLTSIDYSVLPVVFMLMNQYYPTWKSYIWALLVLAAIFSFIIEPIIVYLGFYVLIKWTHWYSFILYIPMGLLARWITRTIIDSTKNANTE